MTRNLIPLYHSPVNSKWYVWDGSGIFRYNTPASSSSNVPRIHIGNTYVEAIESLYYKKYNGSVTNYVQQNLSPGRVTIGSAFGIPSASEDTGNLPHKHIDHWEYNGTTYQFGDTVYSVAGVWEVVPVWVEDIYLIQFTINQADSNPPSVASYTRQYGESTSPLPNLTSPTADFLGWKVHGTDTHYNAGDTFVVTEAVTLDAQFNDVTYDVTFVDVGNTVQESCLRSQSVNVPTQTLDNVFHRKGWYLNGEKVAEGDIVTYTPTASVTLVAKYTFTLHLKGVGAIGENWRDMDYVIDDYVGTAVVQPLPTQQSEVKPTLSGYRLLGWSRTRHTPDITFDAESYSDRYTSYTVNNSTTVDTLYALYQGAVLQSLSISPNEISLTRDMSVVARATSTPSDWLGSVTWSASTTTPHNVATYINYTSQEDGSLKILGLAPNDDVPLKITASARAYTWDSQSNEVKRDANVRVYDYLTIRFWTKDAHGLRVEWDDNGSQLNNFYVNTETWEWYLVGDKLFPDSPSRVGFVFTGWVDADGNLVDLEHPPHIPIDVEATWAEIFKFPDRDSSYLQLFNFDSTRMISQFDLGIMQSLTETFTTGVSATATPTMTSANTFITNMNCKESVTIQIGRKCPDIRIGKNDKGEDVILNDLSDNPLDWTNRKWLTEVRKLVDRWQSATDGIKLLYIPRGMRIIKVLDQYAGIGDNYDLLGYVKEFDVNGNNSGLLFKQFEEGVEKTYVLTGFNGIISSFTDDYTAMTNRAISVTFTVNLGGMKSKYQNWKDALVLLK